MTDPVYPSARAVLETALAQICHEEFSVTAENPDICPADQSRGRVCTCAKRKFAVSPAFARETKKKNKKKVTGKGGETTVGLSDGTANAEEQMCVCETCWCNEGRFHKRRGFPRTQSLSEKSEEFMQRLTASSESSASDWFQEQ